MIWWIVQRQLGFITKSEGVITPQRDLIISPQLFKIAKAAWNTFFFYTDSCEFTTWQKLKLRTQMVRTAQFVCMCVWKQEAEKW